MLIHGSIDMRRYTWAKWQFEIVRVATIAVVFFCTITLELGRVQEAAAQQIMVHYSLPITIDDAQKSRIRSKIEVVRQHLRKVFLTQLKWNTYLPKQDASQEDLQAIPFDFKPGARDILKENKIDKILTIEVVGPADNSWRIDWWFSEQKVNNDDENNLDDDKHHQKDNWLTKSGDSILLTDSDTLQQIASAADELLRQVGTITGQEIHERTKLYAYCFLRNSNTKDPNQQLSSSSDSDITMMLEELLSTALKSDLNMIMDKALFSVDGIPDRDFKRSCLDNTGSESLAINSDYIIRGQILPANGFTWVVFRIVPNNRRAAGEIIDQLQLTPPIETATLPAMVVVRKKMIPEVANAIHCAWFKEHKKNSPAICSKTPTIKNESPAKSSVQ